MFNQPSDETVKRDELFDAIRSCWTVSTSAAPGEWFKTNPARGQCDVTSLVLLEHLGGDLLQAGVLLDGVQVEHHYWNRIGPDDEVDLTGEQFIAGQKISKPKLMTFEFVRANYLTARKELRDRHVELSSAVSGLIGAPSRLPLAALTN